MLKKEILFLQDKILIFDKFKVASVDYKNLILSFSDQRFVESEFVPKDSKVDGIPAEYLTKYFTKTDGGYQIKKEIQESLYRNAYSP